MNFLYNYKCVLSVSEIHEMCRKYYEAGFRTANPKLYKELTDEPKNEQPSFDDIMYSSGIGKPKRRQAGNQKEYRKY